MNAGFKYDITSIVVVFGIMESGFPPADRKRAPSL
jgi:hypothetical protein